MAKVVDSKKEIIIASLMAIIVALGLGIASYSFFIGTPTPKNLENLLDLYTQKGGAGTNVSGGIFEPNDTAQLYAFLTNGGVPVNNTEITYQINHNGDVQSTRTAFTNESGIADGNFSFLLSQDSSTLGTWYILASATVENKTARDTMDILCQSESSQLRLQIMRDSEQNTAFLPEDNATLTASLTYKTQPIEATNTTFEVKTPNSTIFLTESIPTDSSGTATIIFQIPQNNSLGSWSVTVQSTAYGQLVTDTGTFECRLLPPVLDVFTQRGGYGPNEPSKPFAPYEQVNIYAQVRDEFNKTIPYILIGFEIRADTTQFRSAQTNASGIAEINFTMPVSFDIYVVHSTYAYSDTLLLNDTLTFRLALTLDTYTQKSGVGLGQPGGTFSLNETVALSALIKDQNNPAVFSTPVTFNVTSPNGTMFLTETIQTTGITGLAGKTFTLPSDPSYIGRWTAKATAMYNDVVLSDTVTFDVQ